MSHDVAVLGGGIVGSALAFELAGLGVSTVVLDRCHDGRASDAGAGILSPATTWRTDDIWYPFVREAGTYYPGLLASLGSLGVEVTAYSECGLLTVSLSEGDEPWFEDLAKEAVSRGPTAEIAVEEAVNVVPALGPIRRVLHTPDAARVDGRSMTTSLRQGCRLRGVTWIDDEVLDLETSGDRVTGVRTGASGVIPVGALVIAGGAWSGALGDRLGVSLPISPVKGQIIHFHSVPWDTGTWPIVQPVLGHYLVPWPTGRAACGGTFENDAGFDVRPTAAGVAELLRECLKLAPGLGSATLGEVRVGFRPFSPDDRPLCGALPGWDNIFINTGHGADGLLAGPYSGVLVAACVVDDRSSLTKAASRALAAFDPGRFAEMPS